MKIDPEPDEMKTFITDNFLLQNKYAEALYHEYAASLPIIDYHCHLSPQSMADNVQFKNITELWLDGDHYKYRAMRTLGIDEAYITGGKSPKEKFAKWAEAVPKTLRNPLYHWTHLELLRYFETNELLSSKNADGLYIQTQEKLQSDGFKVQDLIRKMNVEVICTTEDPTDHLEAHKALKKSDFQTQVSTSFRPDKVFQISGSEYKNYILKLEKESGKSITNYTQLCEALKIRIYYFHQHDCRLSDHGLAFIPNVNYKDSEIEYIFQKALTDGSVSMEDEQKFTLATLHFLCQHYHELGWVQQFHLGALRNNNTRMLQTLGPDTGWDSIGDWQQAAGLSNFLNRLDLTNQLAKTILYNLNPSDNEVMASMVGNFNDGSVAGKVQFGAAWWFLDQKEGITKQLNALSQMGMVSCFIGMLTDSRSFMSFPRHEYFRRILCNIFGTEIKKGELPDDLGYVGRVIQNICYYNARNYFDFKNLKG